MNIDEVDQTSCSGIALMGCAYGNIPALNACLEDAKDQGADALLFLGDAIGCCGHSDDVLDIVRQEFDAWLAGNLEQQAARDAVGCGCGFEAEEDEAISGKAFRYALESLSASSRDWIASWPDLIHLELKTGRYLLCHGSPRRTNEFLYRSEISAKPWRDWCDDHDSDGFFCAHTGFPWTFVEDEFVLANCGAAGKPDHDGDPAVHYLFVNVKSPVPDVSVRRVTYDHVTWAEQLEQRGVDEIYRTPLTDGRWTYGLSQVPDVELNQREADGDGSSLS